MIKFTYLRDPLGGHENNGLQRTKNECLGDHLGGTALLPIRADGSFDHRDDIRRTRFGQELCLDFWLLNHCE